MDVIQALVLAIVEGITEYLPVSSTGHMIIASHIMGIAGSNYVKMFTVAVQLGAILAVVVLYYRHFFRSLDFYYKLFIAFLPAAVFGKLFNDAIDAMLENAWVVAISLLLGGVILLFIDRWFNHERNKLEEISKATALKIGFFQVIAMIPGVSRSAATIIGGLSQKLNRKTAAEFSFFLAVPTMFAATLYKLYKYHKEIGFQGSDVSILLLGNAVAFIVAMLAIKGFVSYLSRHGFKIFGYYRIALGIILLIMLMSGQSLNVL